jgi:hypothetical protein
MTFASRPDVATLDHKFRARRTGMSPVEYSASIQHFRKPRRQWAPWFATLAILFAAFVVARA